MPGRKREPSFQLASGTTNERDNQNFVYITVVIMLYRLFLWRGIHLNNAVWFCFWWI